MAQPFDRDELLSSWRRMGRAAQAFTSQRSNAKWRGISWDLSFEQWLMIWQQSGHWPKRGCGGQAYCMCRTGDVGPYSIDNVFIAPFRQNSSEHPRKKSDLPMGVKRIPAGNFIARRRINGKAIYLGVFPTPEQAHAAYLAADGARP